MDIITSRRRWQRRFPAPATITITALNGIVDITVWWICLDHLSDDELMLTAPAFEGTITSSLTLVLDQDLLQIQMVGSTGTYQIQIHQ